jgi:hypothetical protein
MNDDTITVAENYCLACKGTCTNTDPSDYDHLMVEWDALSGAWLDRGASPHDIWSFLGAILLSVARQNNVPWEEIQEVLHAAWLHGEDDAEE